ncbi:hypothetical protein ACIQNG_27505 [Streptomyces sp. NPDC091377]|uniref:hypothetical protein n=1 Tax=Streptomyces sp. NPDC091377 TaxID=3365995 RepID=UPI00380C53BB
MARVLISPSYGSVATRRHWADTVDRRIAFTEPSYDGLLTPDQRTWLRELHPEGTARFWGATPTHDKKFADVRSGDVVLFTGRNQVRAIAEVGAIFRNGALADVLWPPETGEPSWHTVYSLLDLVEAEIPYAELNASIGYRPAHNFPGQMVLRGDKARSVLEDFMITSSVDWDAAVSSTDPRPAGDESAGDDAEEDEAAGDEVAWDDADSARGADGRDPVRVAAAEMMRTHRTQYQRMRRMVVVDRREALLVKEYRDHVLAPGEDAERFYCTSGISDLYIQGPEGAEVIEAKSSAGHQHVRQALGQLLDYAPHSPSPAQRLAGLFPEAPRPQDIALLHRYGIDCIHREAPTRFRRLPAPRERRELMRGVWSSGREALVE